MSTITVPLQEYSTLYQKNDNSGLLLLGQCIQLFPSMPHQLWTFKVKHKQLFFNIWVEYDKIYVQIHKRYQTFTIFTWTPKMRLVFNIQLKTWECFNIIAIDLRFTGWCSSLCMHCGDDIDEEYGTVTKGCQVALLCDPFIKI